MHLKTLLFLVFSCGFLLQGAQPQWVATLSSTFDDFLTSSATDNNGNIVTTGFLWGTVTNGNMVITNYGSRDIVVAKYKPDGVLLWAQAFGGVGEDWAEGIKCDPSGYIYVAGRFSGNAHFGNRMATSRGGRDIVLIRLDPDGEIDWVFTAGGPEDDLGRTLTLQPDGNVLLVGAFRDTCTFAHTNLTALGLKDVFLAKLTPEGNLTWVVHAGGAQEDYFYDVDVHDNRIYIAGLMQGTAHYGRFSINSFGNYDAVTICYSNEGEAIWARNVGSSGADQANGLTISTNGQIFVTGTFRDSAQFHQTNLVSAGSDDVFVISYDTNGVLKWAIKGGGPGEETAYMLERDSFNRLHVAGRYSNGAQFGHFSPTNAGGLDCFYARFSHTGKIIEFTGWGGPANDAAHGIALDASRNVIVSGNFENRMTFGGMQFVSINGGQDAFVTKLHAPLPPGLRVEKSGSQVMVHWTPDSIDYRIQQTTSLGTNTSWTLLGLINDPRQTSIALNPSALRFYRLR